MDTLVYRSATELAALIRNKEVTSIEVMKAHLSQIKRHNNALHAIIQLFEGEALALAAEADEALTRGKLWGPLHGVPITVKEQFWVKGTPSTINSKYLKDFVAPEDGILVTRIKQAGGVILGKTNIPANLTDYQVQGDIYPEGTNPYDTERSPGGSTGGGAAALASGMTPLELGGDFGGSIRVPCHFCGVYGLKPTDKTIPRTGMMPMPKGAKGFLVNMAQAGPLARSIDDLKLLWEVIRGPHESDFEIPPIDWRSPSGKELSQYRIGWTDGWGEFTAGSETRQQLTDLIERFTAHGGRAEKTAPDIHPLAREVFCNLFAYVVGQDMPWIVRKMFAMQTKSGLLKGRPDYVKMIASALRMNAQNYARTLMLRRNLVEIIERFFAHYDVLLCPVSFGPSYRRCKIGTPLDHDGKQEPYIHYCWPYVAPFNASGHPALIMPLGTSKDGLPIGVQIVGPHWSEPELLHFAGKLLPLTKGFKRPDSY